MDKTTAWLVRGASAIVIIFGIGYISIPLVSKFKQIGFPNFTNILDKLILAELEIESGNEYLIYRTITKAKIFNKSDYISLVSQKINSNYQLKIDRDTKRVRENQEKGFYPSDKGYAFKDLSNLSNEINKEISIKTKNVLDETHAVLLETPILYRDLNNKKIFLNLQNNESGETKIYCINPKLSDVTTINWGIYFYDLKLTPGYFLNHTNSKSLNPTIKSDIPLLFEEVCKKFANFK